MDSFLSVNTAGISTLRNVHEKKKKAHGGSGVSAGMAGK